MYDVCCVGHITSDKVVTTEAVRYMPGGTAYYFSCAVSRLDMQYALVTALGTNEMRYVTGLRDKGIEVRVQPSAYTVYFENIYGQDQDQRTQRVSQKADPFTMEQLQAIDAKVFHLGPLLADDFSTDLIKTLAAKSRIALDVQGYLRKVVDEKVYVTDWPDKKNALQYVSIIKADVAELAALSGYKTVADGVKFLTDCGVQEVVITNGSAGSAIYNGGLFYEIPAYRPKMTIDATGCGDTYMAGYLYQRGKGKGFQEAGEFAAAMAGLKTQAPGAFMGTEEDVLQFLSAC
jgi:sugar/nucleoside kinase (ribokinase family)